MTVGRIVTVPENAETTHDLDFPCCKVAVDLRGGFFIGGLEVGKQLVFWYSCLSCKTKELVNGVSAICSCFCKCTLLVDEKTGMSYLYR